MSIDPATMLFFDASCLIAAAGSPSGGSSFLLSVCGRDLLTGSASQPVLIEAERNTVNKLGAEALERYYQLLRVTRLQIVAVPPREARERDEWRINEKDHHVVAAAHAADVQFLITLDRGLTREVNSIGLPFRALTPAEFITDVLPNHRDYPSIRG